MSNLEVEPAHCQCCDKPPYSLILAKCLACQTGCESLSIIIPTVSKLVLI